MKNTLSAHLTSINMELLQGIVAAGEELRSPLILQVSAGREKYANSKYLIKLAEGLWKRQQFQSHFTWIMGKDFEICKSCIDDGFSSVMIDASKNDLKKIFG
jgi:fructose-bisphosphate aldolase class II